MAELRGSLPSRIAAIGIEPAIVGWGLGLSPMTVGRLDRLVEAAARRLRRWGHRLEPAGPASTPRPPHPLPQTG